MANDIRKVAVIGAGTIGTSWATLYAMKGYDVNVYEKIPEQSARGMETVRSNLAFLKEKGMLSQAEMTQSLERVREMAELPQAVEDVDYVQESVVEDYDVKKSVFSQADKFSPGDAILASSSSGLKMTEIQQATTRPEKCIIAHPWNPPLLVPLIEIVPGEKTSRETIDATVRLQESLGKVAVVVNKEVLGYIGNRLAAVLWREAIDLVQKGVATVEDVDKAICAGPGIRWALMGQHLLYHLGGGPQGMSYFIDHIGRTTFEAIWRDAATWTSITDAMKTTLVNGVESEVGQREMGDLIRWRDDRLIKLLKDIYD